MTEMAPFYSSSTRDGYNLSVREDAFAWCESIGEAAVLAQASAFEMIGREPLVREWLNLQDERRNKERDERAEKAVAAAERSALAAEVAAVASRSAAKWTFWAAFIALVTVAVSVMPSFLQWLFL